jgi:hypothetical protein
MGQVFPAPWAVIHDGQRANGKPAVANQSVIISLILPAHARTHESVSEHTVGFIDLPILWP